jgi:hypothetical protein
MSTLMNTMVVAMLCGIFLAVCPALGLAFHSAKSAMLLACGALSLVSLTARREIIVPSKYHCAAAAMIAGTIMLSIVVSHAPFNSLMLGSLYCATAIVVVRLCNFTDKEQKRLLMLLYGIALAESILAILQFFHTPFLSGILAPIGENPVIGTVGNPDFLATFLGVSLFLGFQLRDRMQKIHVLFFYAGTLMILAALLCTKNKGTLLFIALWGVSRVVPKPKLIAAAAILGTGTLAFLYRDSILGRLLLWSASCWTIANHLPWGVGLGQIGGQYIESVSRLFSVFPYLRSALGHHTATVIDAHNIVLNMGAEAGILGVAGSVLFLAICIWQARNAPNYYRAAFALVIFKSLYTVMHNSVTGMVLYGVLTALTVPPLYLSFKKPTRSFRVCITIVVLIPLTVSLVLIGADYYYQKTMVLIAHGAPSTALKNVNRSLAINPYCSDAHLAAAQIFFLEQKSVPMTYHIVKAIALNKNLNTLKISAHMYFYSTMYERALPLYTFIYEVFPDHLTSMTKIAQIYLYQNDYYRAHKWASRVMDTEPRVKNASDTPNRYTAADIINRTGQRLFGGENESSN